MCLFAGPFTVAFSDSYFDGQNDLTDERVDEMRVCATFSNNGVFKQAFTCPSGTYGRYLYYYAQIEDLPSVGAIAVEVYRRKLFTLYYNILPFHYCYLNIDTGSSSVSLSLCFYMVTNSP